MTRKKRRKINKARKLKRKLTNNKNIMGGLKVLLSYAILYIIVIIALDVNCGIFKYMLFHS